MQSLIKGGLLKFLTFVDGLKYIFVLKVKFSRPLK